MNRHLAKIINDGKDIRNQTWTWYKEQSRPVKIGIAVVVVVLIVLIGRSFNKDAPADELAKTPRAVTLALVSDLANNESALPLLGTVTSTSEATIRAESSGKLTRVYRKLGDYVAAGAVIAEFENSGERAAVLSAEGAYDAAKVSRDIARINSGTTVSSLVETRNAALNAINSAYVSMEDAIRVKTDSTYTDPRTDKVHFNVLVPDSLLTLSLEAKRKSIEKLLVDRGERNGTLNTASDLIAELNKVQSETETIKMYLDDMATAYSKALEDTNYSLAEIAAGKANVSAARSAIAQVISSITASRSALNTATGAYEVAGKTSSNSNTAVTTAEAQVKQAQGAYNAALSRLEKTVIRSPISGTLNSLAIETGDFVSAFTEVGIVSNNGALEVVAYVTDEDAKRITVGSPVIIDGAVKGIVTRIASAIDPRTKKIEVRVGITDKTSTLVNGQSVRIDVSRATTKVAAGPLKIPLSALKLTPNGAYVFTTSATGTLVSLKVVEGAILGEEIQILSGLTRSESIVTDARGLKEGMVVTIKE